MLYQATRVSDRSQVFLDCTAPLSDRDLSFLVPLSFGYKHEPAEPVFS